LYEYTCDARSFIQTQHIWSCIPLQAFSDILSPFSYSVLAEISKRAWFRYYERMGLSLPFAPRKLMRYHYGRPYLDIKWICERDVEMAGLEPLAFRINGDTIPICEWTKPNVLGGFRNSRNQRRLADQLEKFMQEIEAITVRSRAWFEKVTVMHWSQAEILQIMEEIERYGTEPLMVFFAARHNLERAYNRLLGMEGSSKPVDRMQMINNTLSDLQGLSELSLTDELLVLANIARQQPSILKWLGGNQFEDWSRHWADHEFGHRLHQFMANYGHRAAGEGEMANPRWFEQPGFLFKGILACAERNAIQPAHIPSAGAVQQLLNTLDPQQRKNAEQDLVQIRQLSVLQSRAMNAFAYILAGTRLWAKAAGHEAVEDQRLLTPDDSFFYELEEVKQMMTGEWNVTHTAEIQGAAIKRRANYAEWQQAQPGDLIFDDAEAYSIHSGLPGVVGEATGPLRRHKGLQPLVCNHAIVGARQFDSGWTPSLPVAGGFLAAAGTPFDPIVAAARIWHVPTVVALGPHYNGLVDGAQTRLDGGRGSVEQ
jgi:rifampicin phosphotransferase